MNKTYNYNRNLKVGDLVVCGLTPGFFLIEKIIKRWSTKNNRVCISETPYEDYTFEYNPLVVIKKVYEVDGKSINMNEIKQCDISHCFPAKEVLENTILRLQNIIKEHNKE